MSIAAKTALTVLGMRYKVAHGLAPAHLPECSTLK